MEKRNTIQKTMVLNAVHHLKNHPTAEDVYAYVVKLHPSISKATVYRNLSGLAQDGFLLHVRMPDGADRFDHTLMQHNHVVCTCCGAICDAPMHKDAQIDRVVESETGFLQVEHSIVFTGICPNCIANKNKH